MNLRVRARSVVATLVALFAAVAPLAAHSAEPLTQEEVLRSSAEHFPAVVAALAEREASAGRALAARGAFDIVFDASGSGYLTGFYDGREGRVGASRELGALGARVYGGYRLSGGDFPIYKDESFTNRAGEAKIGVLFSLLRDRAIDARRFGVRDADLALDQADFDLFLTRIGVQHRALAAYHRWVAAGRQLLVYRDLVAIAEERQKGLEREVAAGARARIFLTENLQNLTRRRVLALEAEQAFLAAANTLSLYYRDASGAPTTPSPERLPAMRADPAPLAGGAVSADAALAALTQRPDLAAVETEIERARNRIALSRNAVLPRLDATYELSNDFGAIGEGGSSRDGVENYAGLKFEMPLQMREGRGRLRAAEAEFEALQQRRRQLRDEAEIELRNIVLDVDMATQRAILTEQEVEQAEAMQAAERRRFENGASDFFLVNIREETAANARVRLHDADLARAIAAANYYAATVNVEGLGL